ncbi:MAG TPA: 3-hydroxyacyl-CoA dehydrogenase NAD-binding domain-containing protein [Steroidobacteraceae bacterium]|nr:3-hydroxyacyl-CoA dehydrogenase NAD-binding domain-containing protein [Steroidobacteraceae bacterium]
MTARYQVCDGVAVIELDNPPLNGLGFVTRTAVVEGIDRAQGDPAVVAIVITGAGRAFSAGADIREFDTPKAAQAPALWTVLEAIEGSTKPVVAAINAMALGGGLELALAAHYRVAVRGAPIGFPEVKLGLLPGAGGTQRFPRAVGLETALNMIVSGAPMKSEQLADTRLFDRMIDGDLRAGAIAFAQEVAARGNRLPRIRDWKVEHANAQGFLAFARRSIAAASINLPAPLKCVDAIEAAVEQPFDDGLKVEREAFIALIQTPASKALRHAFFAERAAARIPGIGDDILPRVIRCVAIVGAGTMGGGIAMNFLNAKIPVTLLDAQQQALDRGVATIRRNYENSAKKGKLRAEQIAERLDLLRPTLSYDALADADLVIEAVFEDYAVKEAVFRQLDAVAKQGAMLATNTSTLDVNRIAAFTRRPQDVLGMHFFSPANVMKLLEIVRGTESAPDALVTAMDLAAKIGKTAVVAGVCDGFIGNRMVEQYSRQAGFLLDEGALPAQVDRAMERFGFAMGPFRMSDLAGNDIGWAIRKRRQLERPNFIYSKSADRICDLGRFGQKTGAGWYDYRPADRTAHPSKEVEALIVDGSRSLGIERREITDGEIVERLVYALVNEGAKILQEGIAARASDIDVVYLNGYGFPSWRGGPMFYADSVGLYNVLRAIRRYARGYRGTAWEPAPLLLRLAESGGKFNS